PGRPVPARGGDRGGPVARRVVAAGEQLLRPLRGDPPGAEHVRARRDRPARRVALGPGPHGGGVRRVGAGRQLPGDGAEPDGRRGRRVPDRGAAARGRGRALVPTTGRRVHPVARAGGVRDGAARGDAIEPVLGQAARPVGGGRGGATGGGGGGPPAGVQRAGE